MGTPGGRLRGDQRDAAEREAVLTEKVARLEAECTALRDAFDTVSDVLVEECDALRAGFAERLRASEARAQRQERALEALTRELGALRADHGALSAEMLPCRALLDSTHQARRRRLRLLHARVVHVCVHAWGPVRTAALVASPRLCPPARRPHGGFLIGIYICYRGM